MPLTPGTRLGTYEIVAPLGAGGMGEVYRAKDLRLGRDVALKVLPESLAQDVDHLARFEREARTVAGLNHPNIVTLHSVEDEDDTRFLTMELVEGRSLADLVVPGGLTVARVLDIAIGIADALAAAHERGVIHRDLKPANVMLTREDRVKVLDFGLARHSAASVRAASEAMTVSATHSEAGAVVGTLPYMAPEQIRGETVDARTDLFALGVLLYELLAGRRPFVGSNALVVSAAILNQAPEPLATTRADVPGDLDRILSRCLEKDPRRRAQSALDVGHELRRLRAALERWGDGAPGQKVATIAVLPFANRSASAEDEYFSDGLADELLNVLAKIRGLRVAARTSAFHFKGKDTTIAEIGRLLNVDTVLEGSVRKAGNRVRISVQIVNVRDGYHLWSETYDRTLEDIFAVQDEIAQSVVKELRPTLLGATMEPGGTDEVKAEVSRAARGRATNPEAQRLVLLGRHLLDRATREDATRAIGYMEAALALDPGFAQGWAHLASAYLLAVFMSLLGYSEASERARQAAQRALSLEPGLPEAHTQLGWILMSCDWDWRGAERSFRRALELSPGDSLALRGMGHVALIECRFPEAIDFHHRAIEQDPLSSRAYFRLGMTCHAAGDLAGAERAFLRSLELAPGRASAHEHLAFVLLDQGRVQEALAEAALGPYRWEQLHALAIIGYGTPRDAEATQAMTELVERHSDHMAFQIAEAFAMRGDPDRAFEWLETSYAQPDTGLPDVKGCPRLRSLHADPRWEPFLRKMKLWG